MFIELIDTLRCPAPHEDSWLVGAFDRIVDRDVLAGRLGCPICRAEYEIRDRVVWFDPPEEVAQPPRESGGPTRPTSAEALRLAALLDLASPGGMVVLEGAWGHVGEALAALIETRLLLLNPPPGLAERSRMSAVVSRHAIPIAAGSARAIALDHGENAKWLSRSSVAALRGGGRLVAPLDTPRPDEVEELARDASWWVAERVAPAALVTLGTTPKRGT